MKLTDVGRPVLGGRLYKNLCVAGEEFCGFEKEIEYRAREKRGRAGPHSLTCLLLRLLLLGMQEHADMRQDEIAVRCGQGVDDEVVPPVAFLPPDLRR